MLTLANVFRLALILAAAAPIVACSANADDAANEADSEGELSSTARAFVGSYEWRATPSGLPMPSDPYLDYASLELKNSRSAWGKYEAQADVSVTNRAILCNRAPCTTSETGTWKVYKYGGDLKLKLRPASGGERVYGIEAHGDNGAIRITRNGNEGILQREEAATDPCALARCPGGTRCVVEGGSASCEVVNTNPCTRTLCAPNTQCVVENGQPACRAINTAPCVKTGCSGHICADEERFSTCEWRADYACYRNAVCERGSDGTCGFRQTQTLTSCLANN